MGENEARLRAVLTDIGLLYDAPMQGARERQERLAKPPGSLGQLEDISVRLAGITGDVCADARKARLVVMCADNGVVKQGVTEAPQSVTLAQTVNLTRGTTGAAVLCKSYGADIQVVDVGVAADVNCPKVLDRKIRYGTADIFEGPAMSREECARAIMVGVECARQAAKEGYTLLGAGEMGIGNTTTSAAVVSCLTGAPPEETVGVGSVITQARLQVKREIVRAVVARERSNAHDVLGVMANAGGLDIAAMAGLFLGAAQCRLPAVIDGFISSVAALCACRLEPRTAAFLFASHESAEPGYLIAINTLGLRPMFRLGMRLGEGSGCPLAFGVIRAACDVMRDMATFEQADINDDYYEPVRGEKA